MTFEDNVPLSAINQFGKFVDNTVQEAKKLATKAVDTVNDWLHSLFIIPTAQLTQQKSVAGTKVRIILPSKTEQDEQDPQSAVPTQLSEEDASASYTVDKCQLPSGNCPAGLPEAGKVPGCTRQSCGTQAEQKSFRWMELDSKHKICNNDDSTVLGGCSGKKHGKQCSLQQCWRKCVLAGDACYHMYYVPSGDSIGDKKAFVSHL